jgi:hypothetical protein
MSLTKSLKTAEKSMPEMAHHCRGCFTPGFSKLAYVAKAAVEAPFPEAGQPRSPSMSAVRRA